MSKVLDKIAALFRLAENNPSPQEAQSALERARALLQEHNLTESDVMIEEAGADLGGDACAPLPLRLAQWKKSLIAILGNYFDVRLFIRTDLTGATPKASVVYYGIQTNAKVAASSFASVTKQIERLAKGYPKTGVARREYKEGLVLGLRSRLNDLKRQDSPQCTALAVRGGEIAEQWAQKSNLQFSGTRYSSHNRQYSGTWDHERAGIRDSSRITLNPVLDRR